MSTTFPVRHKRLVRLPLGFAIGFAAAFAASISLVSGVSIAQAQQNTGLGPNYSAGAINQHMMQQLSIQKNAPYLFRPSTPADVAPDTSEPVIEFQDKGVKARVAPNPPTPDEIKVK